MNPGSTIPAVGAIAIRNLNAPMPATKVCTIPADGFYLLSAGFEIIATDTVGTINNLFTYTNTAGRQYVDLTLTGIQLNFSGDVGQNKNYRIKGGTVLTMRTTFTGGVTPATVYNFFASVHLIG